MVHIRSNWEWWTSADTTSVTLGQSDKSLLSPSCAPWVLNCPGVFTWTDQENCVVQICSTSVENSWCIRFPVWCINSHSHWSSLNFVVNFWTSCQFTDSISSVNSCVVLTCLIYGLVRIRSVGGLSEVFNVVQSSDGKSSIASFVSVWWSSCTINQLLFTQSDVAWLMSGLNLIRLMSSLWIKHEKKSKKWACSVYLFLV